MKTEDKMQTTDYVLTESSHRFHHGKLAINRLNGNVIQANLSDIQASRSDIQSNIQANRRADFHHDQPEYRPCLGKHSIMEIT